MVAKERTLVGTKSYGSQYERLSYGTACCIPNHAGISSSISRLYHQRLVRLLLLHPGGKPEMDGGGDLIAASAAAAASSIRA